MSALTLTVLKIGFLALLWLFVLSAFSVVRSDLFGTRSARAGVAGQPAGRRRGSRPHVGRAARDRARTGPQVARVVEGPDTGLTAGLTAGTVSIGRDPGNTLALTDDYVSTAHARLTLREWTWYAEDLGSTNGTQVDGARIRTATPVGLGVPVRVGKTVVELQTG